MISKINHKGKSYNVDLSKPIDISIPLRAGEENVNAWYSPPVIIEPVRMGDWVGDVKQGGSVNFRNIIFNPHGNGTHTECVGHISKEDYTINQCLKKFFFIAELITVLPDELSNGDKVITKAHLMNCLGDKRPESGNVLTGTVLRTIEQLKAHDGPKIVYGEKCSLGEARLHETGVTFKHIPYDVRAR